MPRANYGDVLNNGSSRGAATCFFLLDSAQKSKQQIHFFFFWKNARVELTDCAKSNRTFSAAIAVLADVALPCRQLL